MPRRLIPTRPIQQGRGTDCSSSRLAVGGRQSHSRRCEERPPPNLGWEFRLKCATKRTLFPHLRTNYRGTVSLQFYPYHKVAPNKNNCSQPIGGVEVIFAFVWGRRISASHPCRISAPKYGYPILAMVGYHRPSLRSCSPLLPRECCGKGSGEGTCATGSGEASGREEQLTKKGVIFFGLACCCWL